MREVCLALIARRIPLVVEKPAGVSRQEVIDIREAAEAAGVPIAVPLVQRGGPTDRWLARAGSSVYESVQFIAGPPDRYLTNGSPWMVDIDRAGGGCMVNLAPHFVDLFLRSAGAVDAAVTAALSSTLHHCDIEDYAALTLTTPDGRVGTIEVGYAFPGSPLKRHCSYMRIGAAGTATIWSDGSASFTDRRGRHGNGAHRCGQRPVVRAIRRQRGPSVARRVRGAPTNTRSGSDNDRYLGCLRASTTRENRCPHRASMK